MKKPLIPFRLLPGSWGLRGKALDRAKAEYELVGDALAIRLAEIEYGTDSDQHKIAKLTADLNAKTISESEFKKQTATIKKEPWVTVVNINMDAKSANGIGEFELDWNEPFVEYLKSHGYRGVTDYAIVDSWFTVVCAAVAHDNGMISDQGDEGEDNSLPAGFKEYS